MNLASLIFIGALSGLSYEPSMQVIEQYISDQTHYDFSDMFSENILFDVELVEPPQFQFQCGDSWFLGLDLATIKFVAGDDPHPDLQGFYYGGSGGSIHAIIQWNTKTDEVQVLIQTAIFGFQSTAPIEVCPVIYAEFHGSRWDRPGSWTGFAPIYDPLTGESME
jgi:hypothetical protein